MYKCTGLILSKEMLNLLEKEGLIESLEFNFTPTEQMIKDIASNCVNLGEIYIHDFCKLSKKYENVLFKCVSEVQFELYLNGKQIHKLKSSYFYNKNDEEYENDKEVLHIYYKEMKAKCKVVSLVEVNNRII